MKIFKCGDENVRPLQVLKTVRERKPNRLKFYDYSNAGWYYVTICTKNHINFFGNVKNEEMLLNDVGKVTEKMWLSIPDHYQFVELDEYVIMPNHIHGIIIIDCDNKNVEDEIIRPQRKTNLSNVIKGFKIGVTKWCKKYNLQDFKWQRSYYDRIIRNEKELYNIRKYIRQNPFKWDLEKHIENLDL